MPQKKAATIVFFALVGLSIFLMGYLVGFNGKETEIHVYTEPEQTLEDLAQKYEPRVEAYLAGKDASDDTAETELIDLNKADAEDLQKIPGVGPKLAERIIAYRREIGGFTSVSQLNNVEGIGTKKFNEIKDLVTVGG